MIKPTGLISFFLCLLFVVAAPISVSAIQNGQDGDPGTDGLDGSDGLSNIFHANGDFRTSEWFGVPGSDGGDGGNGIDGDDADDNAAGGNGGQGGNGGDALVGRSLGQPIPHSFEIRSTAGDGGNGGRFGLGTSPELNGIGGNGGDGGFAFVGIREGRNVTARTTGGNGGDGFGAGNSGGNGGFAYARNFVSLNPDNVVGEIVLHQSGGNGGNGLFGANGGNGATTVFGARADHFSIESNELIDRPFSVLRARFQGQGGHAGGTQDGTSGTAGHAIFFLDQMFDSVVHRADPGSHSNMSDLSVDMSGGRGGDGNATGDQSVSGSHGGNAHAIVNGQSFSSNDTVHQTIQVRVTGGDGGSATGANNTGPGGNGGLAVVDDIHLDLTKNRDGSPTESAISFAVLLNGGHGGESTGKGVAGNGASVSSFNQISADASSESSFFIQSTAGNGGKGQMKNGHGGNAISAMDNRIITSPNAGTVSKPVTIRAFSVGGNAGLGENAINEANGGDAWTSLIQTSSGSVRLESESTAGWGNFGKSGNSTARAYATSDFSNASADAIANIPRANLLDSQPIPTIGINSTADARATSHANTNTPTSDVAVATAVAYASWGSNRSGNALAYAEANQTGSNGLAFANSNSTAFGDRDSNTDNESVSVAVASSSNAATADATAFALGHNVRNQARARINSVSGSARSRATSQTRNWKHLSYVENQAWISNGGTTQQFVSASSTGFRRGEYGNSAGIDGKANVVIAPESGFADAIANGTAYKDVFVDDVGATILGVGEIGASFTDPNASGQLTFHSEFDLSLEILDFHDDANFMLGFFQESVGNGFSELQFFAQSGIQNIANETFSTLSEAEMFFDDRLFDLGPLDGLDSDVLLNFQFDMTVDNVGDGFELGFIFGNASPRELPKTFSSFSSVPEPSALVVSFLFLGILVRRRRTV